MNISLQHLQALYQAYCETPTLWNDGDILNLKQLHLQNKKTSIFLRKLDRKLRLGLLAEQFLFNQMEACNNIQLFAENIQIQKEKRTLGELDALIAVDNKPLHLEIIYKFYVYDATLGTTEIERWIGPNRKDTLLEKLTKLKHKQLPLLYSHDCKSMLQKLKLDHYNFGQRVLFKAQLFVPYNHEIEFQNLNRECIYGFYITLKQLKNIKDCKFYIPPKLDWFLKPHTNVTWQNTSNFYNLVNNFLDNKRSPMFWLKKSNGELMKAFLVWW